jgi:hypothetical protein
MTTCDGSEPLALAPTHGSTEPGNGAMLVAGLLIDTRAGTRSSKGLHPDTLTLFGTINEAMPFEIIV